MAKLCSAVRFPSSYSLREDATPIVRADILVLSCVCNERLR
jgi:hypothetical protein